MFDHGDDTLIEELFRSGESLASVAEKWEVTQQKMRTYCKRMDITIPNRAAESGRRAAEVRQATERGEHVSPVVAEILRLSKGCSVRQIAEMVKRNDKYVARIIAVHKKDQASEHHTKRVKQINELCSKHDISKPAACQMIGISYGAYRFSKSQVDKFCNKKAPA